MTISVSMVPQGHPLMAASNLESRSARLARSYAGHISDERKVWIRAKRSFESSANSVVMPFPSMQPSIA